MSNRQASRWSENTSPQHTKTCDSDKTQLAPQLTPDSRNENEIDTRNIPDDLAEIVAVWPQLPDAIRSSIVTIARAYIGR